MTRFFSKIILDWYAENKRDLPWRKYKDPYTIWLSEILLQQTRVQQGLPYFLKFKSEYPNVEALAQASLDQVLKHWQGLGYYSRAKNLHFTANYVHQELQGNFPNSYQDLIKLKGVGDYTASAIASISFKEAVPVVDGNVIRVLSRYFGIEQAFDTNPGKCEIKKIAKREVDHKRPGDYNQAVMEFGSLQCSPKSPNCLECPLHSSCYAFQNERVDALPFKANKTLVKNINYNFAVIHCKGKTYMQQRPASGIWNSLFQFPLLESKKDIQFDELLLFLTRNELKLVNPQLVNTLNVKHLLSHRRINARFWEIACESVEIQANSSIFEIDFNRAESELALPKLIEKYFDHKSKPVVNQ